MSMDKVDLGYLAGLVDGGGSIYISVERTDSVTGFRIRPRFRLEMKQDESTERVKSLLIDYCEFFDVSYSLGESQGGYAWRFELRDRDVSTFLEALIQYLEIKRDRAVIVVNNEWALPRGTGTLTEEEKKEHTVHLMKKRKEIRRQSANRDSKYNVNTVKEELYNE